MFRPHETTIIILQVSDIQKRNSYRYSCTLNSTNVGLRSRPYKVFWIILQYVIVL
jgi:hypothetical protein